ncbi:MAG TPA: glutamine--tRNA ligase/YqeY domain fusion protein [Candidatus Aminicenantes bacterium]|nr:glutamine--tRNA ligase/YqeY domain fusion protein [Candidatus Aminicenantes bacterium]
MSGEREITTNFIREIIATDIKSGKNGGRVQTRFPPEPNGYLHIGHAKSICLNFGLARDFNGLCNLRFDDTNPIREDEEYVESIKNDVCWLGFEWGDRLYYASDYFERLYDCAEELIRRGLAYVDSLNAEEIRAHRGTLTEPGRESPYRERGVEENLDLFRRMRAGEFSEGAHVLRARIDMKSPNLNMRDPTLYRIKYAQHHRTGTDWCIFPMYDFAHSLSDSFETITHSICTLEFEDHRPLYDWFLEKLEMFPSRQIEFARLNLSYTIMSKRLLQGLVASGRVCGWDDPRMPTIAGLRRRGYSPESIRDFADRIGVAKRDSTVDLALLEHCLREDLNQRALRYMAVLDPVKVVIVNYPENQVEMLEAVNNPEDEAAGTREIPFSREIYIEREDFRVDPPKKYFRLSPGSEIRLKHAYYIRCANFFMDEATGRVKEIHCTYDPESRGGWSPDNRKVKGTSHWVSVQHALDAQICLFDTLFTDPDPRARAAAEEKELYDFLNPESRKVLTGCKVEPALGAAVPGEYYQFLRRGYFCLDSKNSHPGQLVFNRSVTLRDTWARIEKKLE